jgi:TM2 domain-containing membrane protein YozV
MYCRNCGQDVHPQAVACPACGVPPLLETRFCQSCGTGTQANQAMCTKCGVALVSRRSSGDSKKLAAGIFALLLNGLGVHKFYLGYTTEGVIMLLLSLGAGIVTCGATSLIMSVIGIVEGVIYLTKSDEEFERIYVQGRRGWF